MNREVSEIEGLRSFLSVLQKFDCFGNLSLAAVVLILVNEKSLGLVLVVAFYIFAMEPLAGGVVPLGSFLLDNCTLSEHQVANLLTSGS